MVRFYGLDSAFHKLGMSSILFSLKELSINNVNINYIVWFCSLLKKITKIDRNICRLEFVYFFIWFPNPEQQEIIDQRIKKKGTRISKLSIFEAPKNFLEIQKKILLG